MPVRFLSDADLARLSAWPTGIAADDLVTFFSPTDNDVAWLRAAHRPENQLGVAAQLCSVPWLGWVPDELADCPAAAVARLAVGLAIDPAAAGDLLAGYGGWQGRTRRDHRVQMLERLGWRTAGAGERKQLDGFLLARALEHDALGVLLQLACDRLRRERIVRPSVDALSRRVATARDAARTETYHRLIGLLEPPRPASLDRLARRRRGARDHPVGLAPPRRHCRHPRGVEG